MGGWSWAGGRRGSRRGALRIQRFLGSTRGLVVHKRMSPAVLNGPCGWGRDPRAQPNNPGHGSAGPQPLSLSLGPRSPQEGD